MNPEVLHGLNILPQDEQDVLVGQVLNLPDPKTIPDFEMFNPFATAHVQEADDCSGFAVGGLIELENPGIEVDRELQFALSKLKTGDPQAIGQDLRQALLTPVKYGAGLLKDRPISCIGQPLTFLRYISNWGDLSVILERNKNLLSQGVAFIQPAQGLDGFDTILSTMWYWFDHDPDQNRGVAFGCYWNWPLAQSTMDVFAPTGSGHAMYYMGKKTINGEPHLIVQQNYGPNVGDVAVQGGVHYFSRDVVNKNLPIFGAGMLVPYSHDELKALIASGYKINPVSGVGSFFDGLIAAVKQFLHI